MSYDTSHGSAQVSGEGRAAVEAEPAYPEEDGAEDYVGYVVWAVGESGDGVVAAAFAEHD